MGVTLCVGRITLAPAGAYGACMPLAFSDTPCWRSWWNKFGRGTVQRVFLLPKMGGKCPARERSEGIVGGRAVFKLRGSWTPNYPVGLLNAGLNRGLGVPVFTTKPWGPPENFMIIRAPGEGNVLGSCILLLYMSKGLSIKQGNNFRKYTPFALSIWMGMAKSCRQMGIILDILGSSHSSCPEWISCNCRKGWTKRYICVYVPLSDHQNCTLCCQHNQPNIFFKTDFLVAAKF